ncbi:MAG: spore coat associated protein CotJA [Clostridiales bacterium]|nr:spore coat associated protein CotJA [Clostridiales bacterium]
MQNWRQTYPPEQGFRRGTLFPELDLPFSRGYRE